MPRFFFDILDGDAFQDQSGTELPDVVRAQVEAYRILCQVVPLHQARLITGEGLKLQVFDEGRSLLFAIEIVTTLSPAAR